MSAFGALSRVALLLSPTHLLTSVSTDSSSPRYSKSPSARVAQSASSSASPPVCPNSIPLLLCPLSRVALLQDHDGSNTPPCFLFRSLRLPRMLLRGSHTLPPRRHHPFCRMDLPAPPPDVTSLLSSCICFRALPAKRTSPLASKARIVLLFFSCRVLAHTTQS